MTKPIHIDPRRPWSRERKFGWDAIYGPGASGVPVGSGGAESTARRSTERLWPSSYHHPSQRAMGETEPCGDSRSSARPTALPSVLGQEAINIVFALCLAAGTLVSAAVVNEPAPDRQVKVYSEPVK